MRTAGLDLLWLTTPEAIAWLHGYVASWYKANGPMRYPQCYGTAVHRSGRFLHFDNPTEIPVLQQTSVSTDNRWLPGRDGGPNIQFVMAELAKEGWLSGTVGLEFWSYVPNRAISVLFESAFRHHGCEVVDGSAVPRRARRCKSAEELACIEKAAQICDIGHRTIASRLRPGITELQLFGEATAAMMAAGGEFPALLPVFTAAELIDGVPAPVGHQAATRKIIQRGDLLCADLCGVYERYHVNVLRGYYVGDAPPASIAERYQLSGGVYHVIETQLRSGMTVAEVSRILRAYYERTGLWTSTGGWALGYELGLSLPPDWVGEFYFHLADERDGDRVFDAGMVTNFESLFGTALIDTLVWDTDRVRVLSEMPRELIAVPC